MKTLSFRVWGRYALFSDPLTRIGGEKSTLQIPTYAALRGVCEAIYWKPSLHTVIESVTLLSPIRTESKGIRPVKYNGGNDLSYYTYLKDPDYLVKFHYEFNQQRPELKSDWNMNKHLAIFERSLKKGGRRDIFLGTRECQAYVETADEDLTPYYQGEMDFGLMYHSISYADENPDQVMRVNFWRPYMQDGVISYCRPEDCEVRRDIRQVPRRTFAIGENMKPVDQEEGDL